MEKTFTYQFETKGYYLESSDEYEYDYDEYEYTPEDDDLKDAIVEELFYTYFKEEQIRNFFEFLTKKFPKPFEKIGYFFSIEFYKKIFE